MFSIAKVIAIRRVISMSTLLLLMSHNCCARCCCCCDRLNSEAKSKHLVLVLGY
jgi:hypothetical protein